MRSVTMPSVRGSAKMMRKMLPPPGRISYKSNAPLVWHSSREMNRPRPVPPAPVVKNGSKMRSALRRVDAVAAVSDFQKGATGRRDAADAQVDAAVRRPARRAGKRCRRGSTAPGAGATGRTARRAVARRRRYRRETTRDPAASVCAYSATKPVSQSASACAPAASCRAATARSTFSMIWLTRVAFFSMMSGQVPVVLGQSPAPRAATGWHDSSPRPDCGSRGRCWR